VEAAASASDLDLLAASRCVGWAAVDVVVHVRVGLEEMLGGVGGATDRSPDQDAATYWRDYRESNPDADQVDAILWTRRTASAYRRPRNALAHLRMTADTVRGAVNRMTPEPVSFQRHVLAAGDFLATWAVELAVHHLDLGRDVHFGSPTADSLALGRATVEALAGAPLPSEWSDEVCLLAGAGRTPPPGTPRLPAGSRPLPVLG
jgi:Mycothiol maleylpyruvate isomerase N-terminal domain